MESITDRAILDVLEQTSACTGEEFFRALAKGLAAIFSASIGMVGVRISDTRVRVLAMWKEDAFLEPFEYDLEHTPCANVLDGAVCSYPANVQSLYPDDAMLVDMGVEAYFGVPYGFTDGRARGLLVALHNRPAHEVPNRARVLKILGTRAASELDRIENERERGRTDERYRTMIDTCAEGVWMVDSRGVTTFANGRLADMLGRSTQDIIGRRFDEFFEPAAREQARRNLESRAADTREEVERTLVRADGQLVHTRMSTSSVTDPDGKVVGALAMVTDTTAQRQIEQKLRDSERLRSLGLLAGGIAHDFNNLLAAVLGSTDLVEDKLAADHPARPLVENIRTAAERAAELTQQLLAYAGRAPMTARRVDLHRAVREIASLFRSSDGAGRAIELALAPEVVCVRADPGALTQVVLNLLTNATQALGARGTFVRVETRVARVDHKASAGADGAPLAPGDYAVLTVRDDGMGMDEDTKNRIFEPFFSSKSAGRGLGLAAVYGILRAHHGAIEVASTLGVGTTFTVLLPLDRSDDEAPASSPPIVRRAPTASILVADDEELVREIVVAALEADGYTVVSCSNGAEALARFEDDPTAFSAIVLDATMPTLGGYETARAIRARRPETPLLMMSGYADRDVPPDLASVGFVQKPFRIATLLTALARALR
jgi:two-component system cell cycle sensor histidine kinase/response regulator CckA